MRNAKGPGGEAGPPPALPRRRPDRPQPRDRSGNPVKRAGTPGACGQSPAVIAMNPSLGEPSREGPRCSAPQPGWAEGARLPPSPAAGTHPLHPKGALSPTLAAPQRWGDS